MCEIAKGEQDDAVLIAGGLFETFNPPNEAVNILEAKKEVLKSYNYKPLKAAELGVIV